MHMSRNEETRVYDTTCEHFRTAYASSHACSIARLHTPTQAQTATSDELEKLRAKLALIQSELKVATEALAAATAGMQAKDATIEDLQKRLAALQKELQDARDEMDDTVAKQGQLSKCRELIALSQRRIAEDHRTCNTDASGSRCYDSRADLR